MEKLLAYLDDADSQTDVGSNILPYSVSSQRTSVSPYRFIASHPPKKPYEAVAHRNKSIGCDEAAGGSMQSQSEGIIVDCELTSDEDDNKPMTKPIAAHRRSRSPHRSQSKTKAPTPYKSVSPSARKDTTKLGGNHGKEEPPRGAQTATTESIIRQLRDMQREIRTILQQIDSEDRERFVVVQRRSSSRVRKPR